MTKNRDATTIALILIFAMAFSLVALPTANAQEPSRKKTYAFIGATPNPVGVGQEVLLHVGITDPLGSVDYGWKDLTVTVERPDGKTDTLGPIKTDATGGTGTIYIPTMTGTYYLQTHFPEQELVAGSSRTAPEGTIMEASDSDKLELTVTEEPREYWPNVALPTEYWTRPIDAQHWEWAAISGSWVTPKAFGEMRYVPYNDGPETGHILWTKVLAGGGLVGGEFGSHSYEDGSAYESKFTYEAIIIGGVLYCNRFESRGGTDVEQDVVAVDLHTGEEVWMRNWNNTRLSFGQLFYWDSYNFHGIFGYLWSTSGSTWSAYDATTGRWIYTMINVPSGTNLIGDKGEIYRYTVNTRNGWMTLWNSSRVVSTEGSWRPHGNTYNCTWTAARQGGYEWNITIPADLPGSAQVVVLGDKVFGASVSTTEVSSWAFSLNPGQEGQLLFKKTVNAPADWAAGNVSARLSAVSLEDGVFVATVKETRQHYGFSTETGDLLWGPTESQDYLDLYQDCRAQIVNGSLVSGGMSGITYCYDVTTGELLWTYEASDIYNEVTWGNGYPRRSPEGFATDGKIYSGYFEHSPIDPKPRGAPFYCLNATTGEEIWSMYMSASSYRLTALMGDSIIALLNTYDNRIYAIGKGPSATTVSAPDTVQPFGKTVLVEGMVTDVSPGTNSAGLEMRFPNGVPAVSDANMSEWMQYVYEQFSRPTDVNGVEVVISVIDPNNNSYEVGRTTSDEDGFYSCMFTPEVPGKYTVVASFDGSGAYYGSHAKTAFGVEDEPAATPEPTPASTSTADLYLVPGIAGIIVAIAVVGAILVLMLRKR